MMPSWPQLLILIAVIILIFGTKKLRNLGEDLGTAIKGFKKAMNEDHDKNDVKSDKQLSEKKKSTNKKKE